MSPASIYADHSASNVHLLSSAEKFHSSFQCQASVNESRDSVHMISQVPSIREPGNEAGAMSAKGRGIRNGGLTWEHCATYTQLQLSEDTIQRKERKNNALTPSANIRTQITFHVFKKKQTIHVCLQDNKQPYVIRRSLSRIWRKKLPVEIIYKIS